MEKSCEFCIAMRPVVYCQADAAYLCLSCDAKVHSANGLSNRHLRTLLCDSCRSHPACSQCLDHQTFTCRSCDRSLHGTSSQHRRRLVSSYVGCPPANDFAALWGFELDDLDRNADANQLLSTSGASLEKAYVNSSRACGVETEIGSNSQQFEFSFNGLQQQDTSFILQQILDLKKLQLNEVNRGTTCGSEEGQTGVMTFSTLEKYDDNLDRLSDLDKPSDHPIQQPGHPFRELKVDVSTSPFSQTEPSPFPLANTNHLVGESFWQSISLGHTNQNQMWPQNMQDIGVCDEIVGHDNFDIPDMDISFSNFEDLFRGDEDVIGVLHDDRDVPCSTFGMNLSLEKSKGNNGREKQSLETDNVQHIVNQAYNIQGSPGAPRSILRPSYSTLSFMVSRDSTESIGTEFLDSGLSPCISRGKASCLPYDMEVSPVEARGNAMTRYKEKKKTRRAAIKAFEQEHTRLPEQGSCRLRRRNFMNRNLPSVASSAFFHAYVNCRDENQVRHSPRRPRSDVRKRARGKFINTDCDDSDSVAAARSY